MKKYLIVFLISMVPLIELRGAIPYAVGFGLPILPSLGVALLGNMLPVPFIFLFARKLLEWGKDKKYIGKFFTWCLEKGEKGGRKLEAKAGAGLYVALLLFVGIPIPGTGAWTGTLAASILDMDFKKSVIFILLGNSCTHHVDKGCRCLFFNQQDTIFFRQKLHADCRHHASGEPRPLRRHFPGEIIYRNNS